jgi:hypothetical protein
VLARATKVPSDQKSFCPAGTDLANAKHRAWARPASGDAVSISVVLCTVKSKIDNAAQNGKVLFL